MLIFALTALTWFISGFYCAYYILRINLLPLLIPLGMGIGIILQTFLLNLFLRFSNLPVPTAYWLSCFILFSTCIGLYIRRDREIPPLSLGMSRKHFIVYASFILFIWIWLCIPVIRFEYFDQIWHYPLAATIGHGGLPVYLPSNPEYCTFYHYGVDLIAGVILRVSGTDLAATYNFITIWNVLAVLGLSAGAIWRVNQNHSIGVGLLGMCLLIFSSGADWLFFPFLNEKIHDEASKHALFELHVLKTAPENLIKSYANVGIPIVNSPFFGSYSKSLNSHNINFGLICALLIFHVMLSNNLKNRRNSQPWILASIILGTMPLFYESLWPVPMLMIGLAGVHAFIEAPSAYATIIKNSLLVFIPVFILITVGGGVVTDTLFCTGAELGITEEGSSVETLQFPAAPGYYSWLPTGVRTSLLEPANWLRWITEWGLTLVLFPFLIVHFFRYKNTSPAIYLLLSAIITIITFLHVNFTFIAHDTGRVIIVPLMLIAMLSADWFYTLWSKKSVLRFMSILMISGICFSGGVLMVAQAFYQPNPQEQSRPEMNPRWLADIDLMVQDKWYAKLGKREEMVIDISYSVWPARTRAPMIFGNYSLYSRSRSELFVIPDYIKALYEIPNFKALNYLGVRYVYIDNVWWEQAPPEIRNLLQNTNHFKLVFHLEDSGVFRELYEVLPLEGHPPSWVNQLQRDELPASYYLMLFDWEEIVTPHSRVFHPSFYLTIPIKNYANEIVTQNDLSTDDSNLINQWRETKDPEFLINAGIDYLLLDDDWLSYATSEEIDLITSNSSYILVKDWFHIQTDEQIRLYMLKSN